MNAASPAATQLVASLLVACDAAVSQKSAGTLFSAARNAAEALRKYHAATGASEVTIAFTLEGVEVGAALVCVPDQTALLHDLAYLFEHTIVLSDPGDTGLAIFMRRLADEVREPGLGGLEDIPGVRAGPAKREPVAILEELGAVYPEVSRHAAVTAPPPAGFSPDAADPGRTAPPPAGWSPALDDDDPFKDLM